MTQRTDVPDIGARIDRAQPRLAWPRRLRRPGTMPLLRLALFLLTLSLGASDARAQSIVPTDERGTDYVAADTADQPTFPRPIADPQSAAGYRIGPDDALAITVLQAQELNSSVRVSQQGDISLPLVGGVHAAGMTPQELEIAIEDKLRGKYIRDPDVTVTATDVRSRGVSVVGAVQRPGVVQIRGANTTLLEVLSMTGGVTDAAGDTVTVLRDGVVRNDLKLDAVLEGRDPRLNVPIFSGDVVNVQNAAVVYVIGAVRKPGAFAMRGNSQLTVLRALALGEGLLTVAASGDAVVLRTLVDGARVELPIDLRAVLQAKAADIPLQPQDVLFVPTSGGKVAARATLDVLTRAVSLRALLPY
jgi:polysaccharide export outer membrane protein